MSKPTDLTDGNWYVGYDKGHDQWCVRAEGSGVSEGFKAWRWRWINALDELGAYVEARKQCQWYAYDARGKTERVTWAPDDGK